MRTRTGLVAAFFAFTASSTYSSGKLELQGYAEYRLGPALVVDGQRVVADAKTRIEGAKGRGLSGIPLGYEVKVKGSRRTDGSILATRVEAKPDGMAMFESDVVSATNEIERVWVQAGAMYSEDPRGQRQTIGEIVEEGPEVQRVRRIMARLVPPYVSTSDLRVRVVDTEVWNAAAMGNGAIWVYRGLLEDLSDDELAIILGHELGHYTHEHSRRGAKSAMWGQLAGLAGMVGGGSIEDNTGRQAATLGALLSVSAWQSGYSRDLEDQADRVGLRYAHEGGFDVSQGPALWQKIRKKYSIANAMTNFWRVINSRPSEWSSNLVRYLKLNYRNEAR